MVHILFGLDTFSAGALSSVIELLILHFLQEQHSLTCRLSDRQLEIRIFQMFEAKFLIGFVGCAGFSLIVIHVQELEKILLMLGY